MWLTLRPILLNFLRAEALKLALKKILGSAVAGGLRGWLIKTLFDVAYDELEDRVIKPVLREAGYTFEKVRGKILIKRLNDAETNDDYNDTIDDIIG